MHEPIEIKCPLCKSNRNMEITSRNDYYELVGENGVACIVIECRNCHLEMIDHTREKRYEQKRGNLIRKWNKLNGIVEKNNEENGND